MGLILSRAYAEIELNPYHPGWGQCTPWYLSLVPFPQLCRLTIDLGASNTRRPASLGDSDDHILPTIVQGAGYMEFPKMIFALEASMAFSVQYNGPK